MNRQRLVRVVPTLIAVWFVVASQISVTLIARAQESTTSTLKLSWEIGTTGSLASFRGISSPSEKTVWLAGSKSTVLLSTDGGSSWNNCSPSYGDLELRSIVGLNNQQAIVASAGTPAVILLTDDAGKHWREVYRNDAKEAFFDSMKFWDDQRGIAMSDPVNGKFLMVLTTNGGQSWQPIDPTLLPDPLPGEAAFAASNSSLLLGADGEILLGTGGADGNFGRIFCRDKPRSSWQVYSTCIPSSKSAGVFALQRMAGDVLIAVGGDYRPGEPSPVVVATSHNGGRNWIAARKPPKEFRSAVAVVQLPRTELGGRVVKAEELLITVGPTGSDYSLDGDSWQQFSTHGFHALSSNGMTVFATGANGRFAKLTYDAR